MDYLPLFHDVKQKPCLVVGGGTVAARKIALLLDAGADVTVLSPSLTSELQQQVDSALITHIDKTFDYSAEQLGRFILIISATDDPVLNERVSSVANAQNIPVNVVDQPRLCSFIFPAIVDRSPMTIAISSGGKAPVLSRSTREKLETLLPQSLGKLAGLAEKFRQTVKVHFTHTNQRRLFWESIFTGPIADYVYQGKNNLAEEALLAQLRSTKDTATTGVVYLVGGGPGDPELLTLKALRLIQQADLIVYDRLVSPEVLNLARRDAERIYAGKKRSEHTLSQGSINNLLIKHAQLGKRVVRLKGGDPFIFGRGGEEIETLLEKKIPFEVVPGITAASGCASYAGIPLTHRDYAQSCVFVTGNLKENKVNLDWDQLAKPNQTIVIYMGLVGIHEVCRELIAHGLPKNTPAALIQKGTTVEHKVFISNLNELPSTVSKEKPKPPTLIIIGHVVSLHEKLNWI
ncbi:MAG: sirohydrochlorin ferrochelatase [Cycloclasticus sp. symbiont of Poecilosclerida sp. M]|nr:MAG: sirohydrochlorin ferrochelatase [Cycloclasticus sp. symbiont of Poecilosclerida sp. M]